MKSYTAYHTASEVTTLWRYRNECIIIIIIVAIINDLEIISPAWNLSKHYRYISKSISCISYNILTCELESISDLLYRSWRTCQCHK